MGKICAAVYQPQNTEVDESVRNCLQDELVQWEVNLPSEVKMSAMVGLWTYMLHLAYK